MSYENGNNMYNYFNEPLKHYSKDNKVFDKALKIIIKKEVAQTPIQSTSFTHKKHTISVSFYNTIIPRNGGKYNGRNKH